MNHEERMSSKNNQYGAILKDVEEESDDDEDDDSYEMLLQVELLKRVQDFTLPYNKDKGYRATQLNLWSFARPHMRTFHGSWLCFMCSFCLWFSMAPLLPYIQESFGMTRSQIWISNMWSMVGAVVLRLTLGPLCDQYGARGILTGLLALCAIPTGLAGLLVQNTTSLMVVRTWIGCVGGTLVPAQYWVMSHFVRDVCGVAMALGAGWGAMGGGLAQVVVGTVLFPILLQVSGSEDVAWRLALVGPSLVALGVAVFFYYHSDDCPLGNYAQVQQAGLMQERSAVDSFRAGVVNLNAWMLFLQFGATMGIELTMENGIATHLSERFDVAMSSASAYASLFGFMNLFARGLGGYLSDRLHQRYSLRGRLSIQMILLLLEGIVIFGFRACTELFSTLMCMVSFAILGQMSMGACFGIVPYVDGPNTGTIAGIVGAGGNVGAIWMGNIFRTSSSFHDRDAFRQLATFCILTALLTPFIVVKGYRGLVFGRDAGPSNRLPVSASPLLTPRRLDLDQD